MESYETPISRSNRKARRQQLLTLLEKQIPLQELVQGMSLAHAAT